MNQASPSSPQGAGATALWGAWERDAEWLTAQYNNRALVPDHPTYLTRWAERSAAVRDQAYLADQAYGPKAAHKLDVFGATGGDARQPAMVFIHGGWWRALDKSDHSFVAPAFTQAGVQVVVPNYTLCPKVGIADIALEMTQAVAWVWDHAEALRIDRARISVAGHSAGGHLAAMLLACDWSKVRPDMPSNLIRSALAISGVFDLEPLSMAPFLQQDLRLDEADIARLSPARFAAPAAGELRVVVGQLESSEFQRQSALIEAVWGSARVPNRLVVPGCHHFSILDDVARVGSLTHRLALRACTR